MIENFYHENYVEPVAAADLEEAKAAYDQKCVDLLLFEEFAEYWDNMVIKCSTEADVLYERWQELLSQDRDNRNWEATYLQ